MKKVIPFKKDLIFKTKVCEVTSISLEHTLNFINEEEITGEFIVSGDYKMTEGSINREDFLFKLPFDIILDSKYNLDNIIIDIDDFYYEIINDDILRVNIDVFVEGEELIEEIKEVEDTLLEETREEKEEIIDNEEVEVIENTEEEEFVEEINERGEEIIMDKLEEKEIIDVNEAEDNRLEINIEEEKVDLDIPEVDLFDNLSNNETYVKYHVYIMKEEDTIDSVMLKYSVSKEALENYNNLDNIKIGDKIIIPTNNE